MYIKFIRQGLLYLIVQLIGSHLRSLLNVIDTSHGFMGGLTNEV